MAGGQRVEKSSAYQPGKCPDHDRSSSHSHVSKRPKSETAAGAPDRGGSRSAVTTRSPTASAAARREDPDSTTNHLRKPSAETQRSRAAPEGAARDLHTARRTQPPGLPAPPP